MILTWCSALSFDVCKRQNSRVNPECQTQCSARTSLTLTIWQTQIWSRDGGVPASSGPDPTDAKGSPPSEARTGHLKADTPAQPSGAAALHILGYRFALLPSSWAGPPHGRSMLSHCFSSHLRPHLQAPNNSSLKAHPPVETRHPRTTPTPQVHWPNCETPIHLLQPAKPIKKITRISIQQTHRGHRGTRHHLHHSGQFYNMIPAFSDQFPDHIQKNAEHSHPITQHPTWWIPHLQECMSQLGVQLAGQSSQTE